MSRSLKWPPGELSISRSKSPASKSLLGVGTAGRRKRISHPGDDFSTVQSQPSPEIEQKGFYKRPGGNTSKLNLYVTVKQV